MAWIEAELELLRFMLAVAERADHVLLGTATPIQTKAEDLWDLICWSASPSTCTLIPVGPAI